MTMQRSYMEKMLEMTIYLSPLVDCYTSGAIQLPKILYKSSHFLCLFAAKLVFQLKLLFPSSKMILMFVEIAWSKYLLCFFMVSSLDGMCNTWCCTWAQGSQVTCYTYIIQKKVFCKIVYRCSQRCFVCVCSEVVAPPPRVWGSTTTVHTHTILCLLLLLLLLSWNSIVFQSRFFKFCKAGPKMRRSRECILCDGGS